MEQGSARKDCHSFPQTHEEIAAWRAERRKNYPLPGKFIVKKSSPSKVKAVAIQKKKPKNKASLIVQLLNNQAEKDAYQLLEIFKFISSNQPELLK
jgi:hypothetical protein